MKLLLATGGVVILVIVVSAVVVSSGNEPVATNSLPVASSASNNAVESPAASEPEYDVLKHQQNGGTEPWINVALFVESQDQDLLKQIAFKYRKEKCDIQCNIEIWDDRKAFEAQDKYDRLVGEFKYDEADVVKCSTEDLRHNHLVGSTSLFEPDSWQPYPIKEADGQPDPLCAKYNP